MSISNYSFNPNGLFSSISQNTWSRSGDRLNFDSTSYDLFGSTNTHYDFSISSVVVGGIALAIPFAKLGFAATMHTAGYGIVDALCMGALGGVGGFAVGAFAGYVIANAVVDYITTDKPSVNTNELTHTHESVHTHESFHLPEASSIDISTLSIGTYFLIGCCTALVHSLDDAMAG